MKKTIIFFGLCAMCLSSAAQSLPRISTGKAPARSEFVSYGLREAAETRAKEKSQYYVALLPASEQFAAGKKIFTSSVALADTWLDREFFIHVEGSWQSITLFVNGKQAGYTEDDKTPAEFGITQFITNGSNTITFELSSQSGGAILSLAHTPSGSSVSLGEAYLYSQPKTRIEDYQTSTALNVIATAGLFEISIAVKNSYNYPESIHVGFDLYSPAGERVAYDKREVTVAGGSRDTVRFDRHIGGPAIWSPTEGNLYRLMMIVWSGTRIIEYIPAHIGFRISDNTTILYDLKTAGKSAAYNVPVPETAAKTDPKSIADAKAAYRAKVKAQITALFDKGVIALRVPYPQPSFFYDVCDAMGMTVVEQANINAVASDYNPCNDPRLLDIFIERQQYMFGRVRNRVCVGAWSLGGGSGNGYNMYKAYQWMKATDPSRLVIYDGADGEWNSDL